MPPLIRCRTLGPPALELGDVTPPALLWRKHFALLVYLARSPRRSRAREHLVALLWGDRDERSARHSLNEALRLIRRHAGDDALDSTGSSVTLREGLIRLDVDDLAEAARAGEWEAAAELVGGEFLEGLAIPDSETFEDWLAVERADWKRVGVEALVRCAAAGSARASHREAITTARRAVALEPRSDPAARALIRALALGGYRTEALGYYELFARRLDAELGSHPEAETSALADRVRADERSRPRADPDPAAITAVRQLPLVGRAPALARLTGALEAARAAPGSALCIVEGDAGLGRTRLLEEIAGRCRLDGWAVATTRAVPEDRRAPWSALAGLLRGGLLDAAGAPGASPGALAALAELAPEWRERFPGPAAGMGPETALAEVLASVTQELPALLVMDDAMWADAETLGTFARVLRDLAKVPCVVLASVASHATPPELEQLRSRIGRDLGGCAVTLARLDAEALRRLAAELLPTYDPQQIDRIARRVDADAAGSPFFAVELLRAVASGMDLGRLSAPWPSPERTLAHTFPAELPDPLVAAIRINFRRLSPEAQAVLAAAAILPDRNTEPRLAQAAGLDEARTAAALDEAELGRWLVTDARGYTFAARLVRDVVARDMLTPGQRRRMLERVERAPAPS